MAEVMTSCGLRAVLRPANCQTGGSSAAGKRHCSPDPNAPHQSLQFQLEQRTQLCRWLCRRLCRGRCGPISRRYQSGSRWA